MDSQLIGLLLLLVIIIFMALVLGYALGERHGEKKQTFKHTGPFTLEDFDAVRALLISNIHKRLKEKCKK